MMDKYHCSVKFNQIHTSNITCMAFIRCALPATRPGDHVETTAGMKCQACGNMTKNLQLHVPNFLQTYHLYQLHFCHLAALVLRSLPAPFTGAPRHQFLCSHWTVRVWRSLPAPVTGAPHTLWQCHVQSMRPCSHASCKHSLGMLSAQL